MIIKVYPPIDNEKNYIELKLEHDIKVIELLESLLEKYKYFETLFPSGVSEELMLNQVLVLVNKKLAYSNDYVSDEDKVEILPPLVGG